MEFMEAVARRVSCRSYTGEPLTPTEINMLLLAANAAPVGMAKYNDMHICVLQNRDILRALDGMIPQSYKGVDAKYLSVYGAPCLFIVSARNADSKYSDMFYSSAGCILENTALAATSLGLGSVYLKSVTTALCGNGALCRDMHIPEGYTPLSALAVGHADKRPERRELTTDRIHFDIVS